MRSRPAPTCALSEHRGHCEKLSHGEYVSFFYAKEYAVARRCPALQAGEKELMGNLVLPRRDRRSTGPRIALA